MNEQIIPTYSDPTLYSQASRIRQQADAQWVLDQVPPRRYQNCLDIACGDGNFLVALAESGRVETGLVGIDRSAAMVTAARERLRPVSNVIDVRVEYADALTPPNFPERFDLVTLLAAIHWMYPSEARVFSWVRGLLGEHGLFCMTTYHPSVDDRYCGGTDLLVLEAMHRIGGPSRFPQDFIPMGKRTRRTEALESMLKRSFALTRSYRHEAVTRVTGAEQYARFHEATFGDYYSRLLHADLRPRYLEALGEIAMERMASRSFVTSMEVRLWMCEKEPYRT
jgi:SAM-dependent methyltransferase